LKYSFHGYHYYHHKRKAKCNIYQVTDEKSIVIKGNFLLLETDSKFNPYRTSWRAFVTRAQTLAKNTARVPTPRQLSLPENGLATL
jgi:hypothetical protein